jgi:hypothetical protein
MMTLAERTSALAVLLAAALSSPAAAQSGVDRDGGLSAAVLQAGEAVAAQRAAATTAAAPAAPKAPPSCSDARELETPFEATLSYADGRKPLVLRFEYAGCREEGRNDYLPPYTERDYRGPDGYGLTVVTNDGEPSSEVLLSQGRDWAGDFGKLENAKLVSGDPLSAGDASLKEGAAAAKVKVSLRGAAKPLYAQALACEAALQKQVGSPLRDAQGRPNTGFASYGASLVLLTATDAYYYHEDCDICAALDRCALKTAEVTNVITANSVSCGDVEASAKGQQVVYDACAAEPR